MRISRREFLKYCTVAAGALGITSSMLLKLEEAMAKVGDGGPHVVWLPGQACTGCTTSLANSVYYATIDDVLLHKIDLDYSETLMSASGAKAVESAVSAIGKTTVLALEGAIPATENFCTIWTRTGGIVAAGSVVDYATNGTISDGTLISKLTSTTLNPSDVLKAGSELVQNTFLPLGTIIASAADRKFIKDTWSVDCDTAISSGYGTERTNRNVLLGGDIAVSGGVVEITGGTNSDDMNPTSGSRLSSNGTVLGIGTIVTSSYDRLWLENRLANTGDSLTTGNNTDCPALATGATIFTYDVSGNKTQLTIDVDLLKSRRVSGPMSIAMGSTIGDGSMLRAGTKVTDPAVRTALIADSSIATLFDGYGSTSSTVFTLAGDLTIPSGGEIVLKGDVTLPPLFGGSLGQTAETDKTMLHESRLFGSSAAYILCVGTCSSFGGIPAANGNLTGASGAMYTGLKKPKDYNGVLKEYAAKTINIPGCPPHPDWIVGTIAYILATNLQLPPLEAYARPYDYYGQYQCNAGPCEWRYNQGYNAGTDETGYFNPKWPMGTPANVQEINSSKLYKFKWAGDPDNSSKRYVGCIGVLGCKGRKTKADCSLRRWNADAALQYGSGWCVASGAGCHGCTEPTFPDKVGKFFNFA